MKVNLWTSVHTWSTQIMSLQINWTPDVQCKQRNISSKLLKETIMTSYRVVNHLASISENSTSQLSIIKRSGLEWMSVIFFFHSCVRYLEFCFCTCTMCMYHMSVGSVFLWTRLDDMTCAPRCNGAQYSHAGNVWPWRQCRSLILLHTCPSVCIYNVICVASVMHDKDMICVWLEISGRFDSPLTHTSQTTYSQRERLYFN